MHRALPLTFSVSCSVCLFTVKDVVLSTPGVRRWFDCQCERNIVSTPLFFIPHPPFELTKYLFLDVLV